MKTSIAIAIAALATSLCFATDTPADRVATVMNTPGCVAFWDFVKREPDGVHPFTRLKVIQREADDGTWTTTARDLADARLNLWWYPHDSLYPPANDGTGGPFTIGRVIHSSRSVGFTGWIGGVAVFNRALSANELKKLVAIVQSPLSLTK